MQEDNERRERKRRARDKKEKIVVKEEGRGRRGDRGPSQR